MNRQRMLATATVALCFGMIASVPAHTQSYPRSRSRSSWRRRQAARTTFRRASPRKSSRRSLASQSWWNTGRARGAIGRGNRKGPAGRDTLFMGNTSTLAVIPAVSTNAGYDPVKNFTPIIRITEGFQILVVHPSSPSTSIKQLVDETKANPGKINYAHTGAGGLPHLAGELFMLRSGAKMTGVSYRSGGELGDGGAKLGGPSTLEAVAILVPQIREGKLRALAAQNGTRTKLLPDLPTMAEVGVPGAEANTFFGVVAPAGTPASVIKTLNETLNEGMKSPDI